MIDFASILNRTPEESKAIRDEFDREYSERKIDLIRTRKDIILQLSGLTLNSDWDRNFIDSMLIKIDAHDFISGLAGGELAFLSDKQVKILSEMKQKYIVAKVEVAAEPKQIPDYYQDKTVYPKFQDRQRG